MQFTTIYSDERVFVEEATLPSGRVVQVRGERIHDTRYFRWTWDVLSREGYFLASCPTAQAARFKREARRDVLAAAADLVGA